MSPSNVGRKAESRPVSGHRREVVRGCMEGDVGGCTGSSLEWHREDLEPLYTTVLKHCDP